MTIAHQLAINVEYIKMRWHEPYVSGGLNRKLFGIMPAGIYHGFSLIAGPGDRQVTITTDDPFGDSGYPGEYASGNFDCAGGYSIAVCNDRRGMQTTVSIEQGVSGNYTLDADGYDNTDLYAVIKARFYVGQWTDAYFALVTADEIENNPEYNVIGRVAVPGIGVPIDSSHISYRDGLYPRTEPYATWHKWGYMRPEYVRKLDTFEELMYRKLTGGGNIQWDGTTVIWDDVVRIYIPGRDDVYYVNASSATLSSNGKVFYAVVPHTTPITALDTFTADIGDIVVEGVSGIAVPIFIRAFNRVYSGDGGTLQLQTGESVSGGIDTDLPAPIQALLGISETASVWGFTNNFPGAATQNAPQRWSSLSLDDQNLHEDRNILLSCSGNVAWDLSSQTLTWADPFVLLAPNKAYDWKILASSITSIADGDSLYVAINRDAGGNLTLQKAASGALALDTNNKNNFVIAYRLGDKIIFRNGYTLRDGDEAVFEDLIKQDTHLRWDAVEHRVVGVGNIEHLDGGSGTITWDGAIYIRSLSGELYYELASGSITLDDEYVGYVDLQRDLDILPKLLWVNGSDVVASVGNVAWTSLVTAGDWIKKKSLGYSKYYQIQSVDDDHTVTLTRLVTEASSAVLGDKSQYALLRPNLYAVHRRYLPEDGFWLFFRDDRSAPRARVQVRDLGEVGEGERITTTNWVYDEDLLTSAVSGVDSLITLPTDSRDAGRAKYYRVGSGDLQVLVNGVVLSNEKIDTSPLLALSSYNSGTGLCSVSGGLDISLVRPGDFYHDALNRITRISGPVGSSYFYVPPGSLVDPGFGGYAYRHQYEEVGADNTLSDQVKLKISLPANATVKFRLHPINRAYSDGMGSGVSGGTGGGGAGTLEEAYIGGHVVNVQDGRPVTFVGAGLTGKTFRVLGDMEVSGVVDPTAVTYEAMPSNPAPGKNTNWFDLAGNFWLEDTVRGLSHCLTEQGKWKGYYQNTTGAGLLKGRIAVKDGANKIKYANNSSELLSNVIGIIMSNIGHTGWGFVQRAGWIEGALFDTACFVETALPTDGVLVWLADSNGQMSVSAPAVNSGKRAIAVGIWDDGGLLWQVRDFGRA